MEFVIFICEWPNSQLDPPLVASLAGWSWSTRLLRTWFGTVLRRSQVTLEMFISCKLLLTDTVNSRQIDLRMACEGRELTRLSWCGRESLLLLSQLYTFCLLVCQSLPEIDVNTRLQSSDESLTTAHESKKSTRKSVLNWSRFGVNLSLINLILQAQYQ